MRIGVVSDTHDNSRNVGHIVEVLNRANVDRVVHTGDITRGRTLEQLAQIRAPIFAVYGNNDVLREELDGAAARHGIQIAEPPFEVTWEGHSILVVHDPREIAESLKDHRLVLHGHNHRRVVTRESDRLIFNPGECAGHMVGLNAVGVVDPATLAAEILSF